MRTWEEGERALRREVAVTLRSGPCLAPRPVVAVGREQPRAIIALRGLDPSEPARTLAELAVFAAEFRPSRVIVGLPRFDAAGSRRGTLIVEDVQLVADGRVEMLRGWAWRRMLGHILWLPVEVRHWRVGDNLLTELARAILAERPVDQDFARLRFLVRRHLAAGHRLQLAPSHSAHGSLPGS